MASTDLDTVSPGLSPACYYCGYIVTLDKLFYSTCALSPTMGKNGHIVHEMSWIWQWINITAVAALIVCSPVEDAIDCTGLARG